MTTTRIMGTTRHLIEMLSAATKYRRFDDDARDRKWIHLLWGVLYQTDSVSSNKSALSYCVTEHCLQPMYNETGGRENSSHALPDYSYLPHSFIGNEQELAHVGEGMDMKMKVGSTNEGKEKDLVSRGAEWRLLVMAFGSKIKGKMVSALEFLCL